MRPLADGFPAPAEVLLGPALATPSHGGDGLGHEETSLGALEGLGGVDEEGDRFRGRPHLDTLGILQVRSLQGYRRVLSFQAPKLSDEQWQLIDENIFLGTTIGAIKAIRDATGVGVHQAVDIAEARRRSLEARFPTRFVTHSRFNQSKSVIEDSKPLIA